MSFLERKYHAPGIAPGTYNTKATRERAAPRVTVTDFSEESIETREGLEVLALPMRGLTRWVRVSGRPSLDVLETLRERLELDPLALEDVANAGQRPKFNDFDTHVFVALSLPDPEVRRAFHQLSLCLVGDTLVTFADDDTFLFEPLEQRLDRSSRLRSSGAHFLFYAIIDLAIDMLFPLLDEAGAQIDDLETRILTTPTAQMLADAHAFRRDLLVLRRIAWATREVVSDVLRHSTSDADERFHVFLQDAYDHIVTVIDIVETHRDVATTLVELYLSMVSNRMNDVIKVLTIIATLFIPPTFIVGVYGMNFRTDAGPLSMPELAWPLGYVGVLGIILVTMGAMVFYFRRKRWL